MRFIRKFRWTNGRQYKIRNVFDPSTFIVLLSSLFEFVPANSNIFFARLNLSRCSSVFVVRTYVRAYVHKWVRTRSGSSRPK